MAHLPSNKRKHWQPTKRQKRTRKQFSKDRDKRYDTTEWRNLSRTYRKLHPLCESPGCLNLSEVTDHITPVSDGGDFWSGPFQALCHSCHNRKSAKEARERNNNL